MKRTLLIIVIILAAISSYYFLSSKKTTVKVETTKQYRNSLTNLSFTYPKILTASTTDNIVTLHHDIPFENTGSCDMMGGNKKFDKLTDFEMTAQIVEKDLTSTVKKLSPYIPQENYVNDELIPSPGFIDTYNIGTLSGFAIYEGAEGCGQTTYYFPIEKQKTLVITNASIQALHPSVKPADEIQKILAIPGVISREENQKIFENILKSLKI